MSLETRFVWQRGAMQTAIRTKELREYCRFPSPMSFYVFLQKGWCELQRKWGLGKKGLGGRLQMETFPAEDAQHILHLMQIWLPGAVSRHSLQGYAIQLHGEGGVAGGSSEGKHSLLNCHFFLRGALNKYKRLNYQQLKLSLWWQPNRSNRFPRTFFIENWIWGPSLKGYTVTSSCRLSLGSLHISKAFQVQKDTENLLRWMSCFCVICWPSGIL